MAEASREVGVADASQEVLVNINGRAHSLWRAVDHQGGVLEAVATKRCARRAALKRLKKRMKRYGQPQAAP